LIISRSPLRISLGGGGTDLQSYYKRDGGYILAAAINKYVYCAVNTPFNSNKILKYSQIENVPSLDAIRHPIIREGLRLFVEDGSKGIEISTLADLPSGTGLGSSGSFTTALIKSLSTHFLKPLHARDIAELACKIEIEILREPIGKQDQYISAFGGLTEFYIERDGHVKVLSLEVSPSTIKDLEENLLLFFTGQSRAASAILGDQKERSESNESSILDQLDKIRDIGFRSRDALVSGDTLRFAHLMNEHWHLKRVRSNQISNERIDNAYKVGLRNGAIGGKLVGAGGGGFLLFYARQHEELRNAMTELHFEEVRFGFDFEGAKVIYS
jgi:D-glycero-alpha-D-manno-heptose-7-phosphate kinase